jgi:hypothetical protein
MDGISSRSIALSGLDEGHGEDRGSGWTSEAHAGTTPSRGPTITGMADDQAWLVEGSLYIVRVRPALVWGELLRKRKTKHAMVRFLATPGVAPGGGTLNWKCTELKLEKVGGSYKLHYGVGYSLITMASALGGLACVH